VATVLAVGLTALAVGFWMCLENFASGMVSEECWAEVEFKLSCEKGSENGIKKDKRRLCAKWGVYLHFAKRIIFGFIFWSF
jgi:hypothetical protein